MKNKEMPDTCMGTTITVIPKENKELNDQVSYCPVFLLNADMKLFPKILTNRLRHIISNYINSD